VTRAPRPAGCDAVRRLLHESLERELSPGERARLDAHLAACSRCRELAADLPALLAALGSLPRPAMPPGLHAAIRARTLAAPRARFGRLALLAAAALVAMALGLWPALHPPRPAPSRAAAAARQVRLALAITGRGLAVAGERGLALSVGDAVGPALARGSRAALAAVLEPPLTLATGLVRPASPRPAGRPREKEMTP